MSDITPKQAGFPGEYQVRQLLDHFPCMVYWRDVINDCFVGCNQKFADFVGLTRHQDIVGSSGYDYFDKELVQLFRAYETRVVQGREAVAINDEIFHPKTGRTTLDVVMAPIFDDEGVVSTIVCYGSAKLLLADKPWQIALKLIQKKYMPYIMRENRYHIETEQGDVSLTKREAECALYILKGMTSKEVAKEMSLAPKTIDNYMDSIKNKLQCHSRSEVSKKLIDCNFISNF